MQTDTLIHILTDWGRSLQSGFPKKAEVISRAASHNPWFTPNHINYAIDQICEYYLNEEALKTWLTKYAKLPVITPRSIGLVMAGNIPLAGFHDLLSILVTGHCAVIKLSEKDPYLLPFCIEVLEERHPELAGRIQIVETLKDFDAVIATGSNNASRYFEAYFGKYPHIIRHNRNSVAVITGDESPEQLERLADDIFMFFGLGCRSVSKLYLPRGYDLKKLNPALDIYGTYRDHHKYRNNLDYNAALLILSGNKYLASDHIILAEDGQIASRIATLHYEFYDSPDQLHEHLLNQKNQLQCIVSEKPLDALAIVPFGSAQRPALTDYADGVDTVDFLLNLEPIETERESKSHR